MNFIGFSPRLFAESIEAAMSDGFEDGSQWRRWFGLKSAPG
jgi:hypothetical protein